MNGASISDDIGADDDEDCNDGVADNVVVLNDDDGRDDSTLGAGDCGGGGGLEVMEFVFRFELDVVDDIDDAVIGKALVGKGGVDERTTLLLLIIDVVAVVDDDIEFDRGEECFFGERGDDIVVDVCFDKLGDAGLVTSFGVVVEESG